jgi:molybdate/tungstate transport system ATP-binding protein
MTAGIAVEGLCLSLGAFRLDRIDLAASRGEILVLLGPNGAGKSVTLETIAGFHRPQRGRVWIAGREVTALPPERRKIGFVVQNFGLFPHLDVETNVAIARRRDRTARGKSPSTRAAGAAALLRRFGIAHLARRLPADLSPGEKQRVALARAIASAPDLFLFDEPFSALDAQTRGELRDELKTYLRELSLPAIFVTHDHSEARTLADKVAVLRAGAVLQSGPAAVVFQKPADSAVARFVGVENIVDGRVADVAGGIVTVDVARTTLRAAAPNCAAAVGSAVRLGIRAEAVTIAPLAAAPDAASGAAPFASRLDGKITGLRELGPLTMIAIDCSFALKAYALTPQARALGLAVGDAVIAQIAAEAVHVMND